MEIDEEIKLTRELVNSRELKEYGKIKYEIGD